MKTWVTVEHEHGRRITIMEGTNAVASLRNYGSADELPAAWLLDELRANAEMIRSAPELVHALGWLREWTRNPGLDDGLENDEVMRCADEVLARFA